ncbi:hypothetical protein D3C73_1190700 [compost metagenome]
MVVAIAAPVKPNAGIGPKPLMKTGQRIMLAIFAIHKLRRAMAAFPAPLKIPLIRNSKTIMMLPPIIMRTNDVPWSAVTVVAPISNKISRA